MNKAEMIELLKTQGGEAWNAWIKENPDPEIDLTGADLSGANLSGANLSGANLNKADLTRADLYRADLSGAYLTGAYLSGANLNKADLSRAYLIRADLYRADLSGANLYRADLSGANLTYADLFRSNFCRSILAGTNFDGSMLMHTTLADCDLSEANNLENVNHTGPSTIGIYTVYRSQGKIPRKFLEGAGVPEEFITYVDSLVATPVQYCSSFISCSAKDQEFGDRLYSDLRREKVRCWLATDDLKIGDKFRSKIDQAIRLHDKLVIVLSKDSINSGWVEEEVESAMEREKRYKKTVLLPVKLDDSVMETDEAWAASIRRTRHIGDFTRWKNPDSYKKAFDRVLRDLKADETPLE